MLSRPHLFLALLGFLLISQSLWGAPRIFQITEGLQEQRLGLYVEYFKDQNGKLSLDGIKKLKAESWTPGSAEKLSLGYSDSAVWLRIGLKNTLKQPLGLFLHEPYAILDQVHYYIPQEAGRYRKWELGGTLSFRERFIPHFSFVAPVHIPPGKSLIVYIRIMTKGRMTLSPGLFSRAGLLKRFIYHDPLIWLYMGFLLLMFVYNFLLYLAIRDQAYLYYVIFVFLMITSRGGANGLGYIMGFPGLNPVTRGIANCLILLSVAMMIQFLRVYIEIKKYSVALDRIMLGFVLLLSAFGVFYAFFSDIIYKPAAAYLILSSSVATTFMFVYLIVKRSREALIGAVAFFFLLCGTSVLTLQILGMVPSNLITLNSVKIGSAIQVVLLSLALADKINLSRAGTLKSEAGYRHLMLNSRNIVFTLDDDFRFRTVNPVIQEYLGMTPEEVLGTNFVDLIFPEGRQASSDVRGSFEENLSELIRSDSREHLRFFVRSRSDSEGRPMRLRLDYTQGEDERRLLGELAPITEDTLKKSIREEEQTYLIGNSINNVEILSHRLAAVLPRFVESDEVFALRLCLREALLNAVEHGNLELEFREKSRAQESGEYFDLLNSLRREPRFKDRKVRVEYTLDLERVQYRITDEGPGFNHEAMLKTVEQRVKEEMNLNGRGLLMIQSEFDRVEFNDKGNSILLVRFFKKGGELENNYRFV